MQIPNRKLLKKNRLLPRLREDAMACVSGVIKLHQFWRFENVCLIFFVLFQDLVF
jgi:hypothetical protein